MEKLLEKLNYFVYDSQADYFDLDKGEAKEIIKKLEEKQDIFKMYDLVFKDMVQCYIENLNMDLEENQEYLKIDEDDKKIIAYKMVYKNEYLWEIINDTIDTYIKDILRERENKENE